MPITEKRLEKIRKVASRRQHNLTILLENVHDTHNIGAVMRTCDSVGIHEIFVLHNRPELVQDYLIVGKNSSSGSRKWVDVHFFTDTELCYQTLRSRYKNIYGTHLNKEAKSLYHLDLSSSVALVFGNEREGLTEDSLQHLDGNFHIPQMGMVQSLNISVACAVSLYEAFRQRESKNMYSASGESKFHSKLEEKYIQRHDDKFRGRAHEVIKDVKGPDVD